MEKFGISIRFSTQPEAFQLKDRIERKIGRLHTEQCHIQVTVDTTSYEPRILCELDHGSSLEKRQEAYNHIANAVAEWIAEEREKTLIGQIVQNEYDHYDALEIRQIQQYCLQIMLETGQHADAANRRKQKIAEAVLHCFDEYSDLHLDGMIRFRMQAYMEELKELVDYAVDEFVMDKQYQEFITLLKYFVFVQEAKIPTVHLIHRGDYAFTLLDERLHPIETKQMEGVVLEMLDQDLNYEDMIVSTLITVSPQTIFIHTQEWDMQVIRTIRQIFEDRTVLCASCPVCNAAMGKTVKNEQPHHV